ncbi:serine acetyltransferase [Rhizobium sp. NTR19]|uniref:Serine acetyltransferase n=2 Tax=Neorhizobium TaxID=1525371 RepID=A0ABT0IX80_9HYPH|nr:serine acetyltransferase [Neorhizobium turbinariae]MCK8782454.1 serine acetyltransferase [Neorhizobium turbinariae]
MKTRLRFLNPQATRVRPHEDVGGHAVQASFWACVRGDYRRHGSRVFNAGFMALFIYRFGRWADERRMPLSRIATRRAYGLIHVIISTLHRVWIPSEATLGEGFHIIHVEGSISIHPAVVIGKRCGIMHNVTIGTNMTAGAPKIGDDVFIGVNSCILGDIRIGDRVRIGANTAVTTDVPSDSIVVGSPAKIYPRLGPFLRERSLDDA